VKLIAGDHARHNLPLQTTSFVGQQEDLAKVQQRLRESRLLTITGSGGCGKTRSPSSSAGGLSTHSTTVSGWWTWQRFRSIADLARVRDSPRHPRGAGSPGGRGSSRLLRARSCLIILDNCEHLIDACARTVDILLRQAATCACSATSRELLACQVSRVALHHSR